MLVLKIVIYSFIFLSSSLIGILISKKYTNRVNELKEFKNALNIFKTKIRYTYEPIPEIFMEISSSVNPSISNVFSIASEKMDLLTAGEAWSIALKMEDLNINNEDKMALNNLSKLLGKTDLQGQLGQIEMTEDFLEEQIKKAEKEKNKNEKLYRTLGMILGLTIVIILM
ncbi:MAG: stage III sporulation protein AB [Clostridia bacterium]|nr:stage III sporulation protein AB [Clostridia bacterium]